MAKARAASFRVGRGEGGGEGVLERQTSKNSQLGWGGGVWWYGGMPSQNILILIPLRYRKMHLKLIDEILKYKLSALKKR